MSFAKEYKFFDAWPALATYLDRKHAGAVSVGVLPHAPLQILS